MGISEHAQAALGDIVFADLPDVGTQAVPGEPTVALESVKATADVYAPIAGEIVEVNLGLADDPSPINEECYSDGWLMKIKVSNPSDMDALLDTDSYQKTLRHD